MNTFTTPTMIPYPEQHNQACTLYFQSNSSVPVNLAYSFSSMVPFFNFFNNRYSCINSSSSSIVCRARLCRAVFFRMTAASGVFFGFLGFGSFSLASFFASRFFFLCFSRDLSLYYSS